ncbi:hypothetical protein AB1Y20_000364 [Prymnesium parvum]|uniref:Copper homeostasis protein cutC homolog n=1 Tax=Prymnesium parvum TaxID=97485 RepID=A0AB34K5N4_PRYPA
MPVPLEVCVDSVASARAAKRGGASRLEVCDSLVEGGTSPSVGLVRTIAQCGIGLPMHVMVRPRGGDFLYTQDEIDVMCADIRVLREIGASGIVLGVLDQDGKVDEPRLRHLVRLAAPLPVTFHRAIDVSASPCEAVRACLRCGVARVLTSGGAPSAEEGLQTLQQMVSIAAGRMILAAGGGVNEHNCERIARMSGVDESTYQRPG